MGCLPSCLELPFRLECFNLEGINFKVVDLEPGVGAQNRVISLVFIGCGKSLLLKHRVCVLPVFVAPPPRVIELFEEFIPQTLHLSPENQRNAHVRPPLAPSVMKTIAYLLFGNNCLTWSPPSTTSKLAVNFNCSCSYKRSCLGKVRKRQGSFLTVLAADPRASVPAGQAQHWELQSQP